MRVTTDVSGFAVYAVLEQLKPEGVVASQHSHRMTGLVTRYQIHNKELLAVVFALEEWRICI